MAPMVKLTLTEALTVFEGNLPEIRKACVENIVDIEQRHQPSKSLTDDDELTVESMTAHINQLIINEKTDHLHRTIRRIDGRKQNQKSSITEADIERAREYPIEQLWSELVGEPIKAGMTRCCFHDDNTASMSLRKYNRYRCFGCDARGDTIDLYMKVQGVDFIRAVKELI